MHGDGDHPRQNHQRGKEHLRHGGDQRRPARRFHGIRGHGALHHEKVRAPVAKRQHKPEPGHHAEPPDPHRVLQGASHVRPRMRPGPGVKVLIHGDRRKFVLQRRPAAHVLEREKHQGRKPQDDHEELQHLVVNGRGKSPEEDIDEDDESRRPDASPVVPMDQRFEELRQRVKGDAGGKHRHHRE